jgi:hypothetical protein
MWFWGKGFSGTRFTLCDINSFILAELTMPFFLFIYLRLFMQTFPSSFPHSIDALGGKTERNS